MIKEAVIGKICYTWYTNFSFLAIVKVKISYKFDEKINANLYEAEVLETIMRTPQPIQLNGTEITLSGDNLFYTFESVVQYVKKELNYDREELVWAIFEGKIASDMRKAMRD